MKRLTLFVAGLLSSSSAFAGAFGVTVYNQSCAEVDGVTVDGFYGFTHCGEATFDLPPKGDKTVFFAFQNNWIGTPSSACNGIQRGPYLWSVGQMCEGGSNTNFPTSGPGTNVLVRVVYMPVYARVRNPNGSETNALVRVYKKEIFEPLP